MKNSPDVRAFFTQITGERPVQSGIRNGFDNSVGNDGLDRVHRSYQVRSTRLHTESPRTSTTAVNTARKLSVTNILPDADPCSFEIAVAPSTTFQRFRLGESY